MSSDTPTGTVKSMGLALIGITEAFNNLKPDMIVILGDRCECYLVAQSALVYSIQ